MVVEQVCQPPVLIISIAAMLLSMTEAIPPLSCRRSGLFFLGFRQQEASRFPRKWKMASESLVVDGLRPRRIGTATTDQRRLPGGFAGPATLPTATNLVESSAGLVLKGPITSKEPTMRSGRLFLLARPCLMFCLAYILAAGLDVGLLACDEPEGESAAAEESNPADDSFGFRLLPVPNIRVAQPIKATEAEATEIRALIKTLAEVEEMNFNYVEPLFGEAPFFPVSFVIVPYHAELPEHRFRFQSWKRLVEYGPKAIPFLLEALDDASPTKLSVDDAYIRTPPVDIFHINPINIYERETLKTVAPVQNERPSATYTAKVGDICFMILGQITNRSYFFIRNHTTFKIRDVASFTVHLYINSPVENESLAKAVRETWSRSDPAQDLFQSLLIDFHTRGSDHAESEPFCTESGHFQTGAALRLAYYFPDEASKLVADRLKGLDLSREHMRENGVNVLEFVRAVSWSSNPAIAAEVEQIFEKTMDEDVFLACASGIYETHDESVFSRAVEFLNEPRIGGHYDCLVLIGKCFPDRAKGVFKNYLEESLFQPRADLCLALRESCQDMSMDLLSPLLSDTTMTDKGYFPGGGAAMVRFRICDVAAETLSTNFPDLQFEGVGLTQEDWDRQIEVMKRQIAEMKKAEK